MIFPVLICDDSAVARKMAFKSLPENFASQVHHASNGLEAIQQLRENEFALLLLDLTMPTMDGVQVLQEIRQRAIEVFVIVISGDIQPAMKERVAQLGAIDFIEKPVDKSTLNNVLKRFGMY